MPCFNTLYASRLEHNWSVLMAVTSIAFSSTKWNKIPLSSPRFKYIYIFFFYTETLEVLHYTHRQIEAHKQCQTGNKYCNVFSVNGYFKMCTV